MSPNPGPTLYSIPCGKVAPEYREDVVLLLTQRGIVVDQANSAIELDAGER